MKKLFSILLVVLAALTANIFNAGAQSYDMTKEAGKVKLKMTVKDVATSAPMAGVTIKAYIRTSSSSSTRLDWVEIGPSDYNGVAYAVVTYTKSGSNGIFAVGSIPSSGSGTIDFDPQPTDRFGYKLDQNVGRVRTWVSGQNATQDHIDQFGGYDNCHLSGNWLNEGATIEFKQYVQELGSTRTVTFKTADVANASDFPTLTVTKGSTVSAPSATPVCTNSDCTFVCWSADGSTPFDFSKAINSSVILSPVWRNPNAKGVIHIKAFLWDHDAYNTIDRPSKCQNYSWLVTGKNGGQVYSNYELKYYDNTGKGWTSIPVSGLRFKLRTYPDVGGAPDHPVPVGAPETSGWQDDNTVSKAVTDINGEVDYIIPAENMHYLTAGNVIDMDPDPDCIGSIYRDPSFGREYCVFNWDWMTISSVQGAGLLGIRYILEGPRHEDTGIKIGNHNDNDALLLTEDNISNGFECTFYCYVLAAPCAQFIVGLGTMPSNTDPALFPVQKFTPINSAGVEVDPWVVVNPGSPAPPSGTEFVGWHELRTDINGVEYESPNPYDFSKTIERSIVLKAKYVVPTQKYTVRWAPDGWTGASDSDLYEKSTTYEDGDYPTYNHELPVKSGSNINGWDLYVKDESGTKSFGTLGNYRFVRTIAQPMSGADVTTDSMIFVDAQTSTFWKSPYAIDDADQIYVARFRTALTITKSGMTAGDSALITVTNGTETRKIVLTGNTAGTAVSKTLYVGAGTWTVTEDMTWSWAYENSTSSQQVTISDGDHATVTFENTAKTTTPQHGEHSVNNVFSAISD